MDRIMRVLRDEQGVETLEWIVVGALMVAVGGFVYNGALKNELTNAITGIGATINALAG